MKHPNCTPLHLNVPFWQVLNLTVSMAWIRLNPVLIEPNFVVFQCPPPLPPMTNTKHRVPGGGHFHRKYSDCILICEDYMLKQAHCVRREVIVQRISTASSVKLSAIHPTPALRDISHATSEEVWSVYIYLNYNL